MSTARRGRKRAGAWLAKQAVKLGVATKPRTKWKDAVGVCPSHVDLAAIGFLSMADAVAYFEALSRRARGKPAKRVVLPPEKRMPGALRVEARRCPRCRGKVGPCELCSSWGWGLIVFTRRPREPKAKPAATTPAASTEATR